MKSNIIRPTPRRGIRLERFIESKAAERQEYETYRDEIQKLYDGPAGALLFAASFISGHSPMAKRLFRPGGFDLRGAKRILDAGCGAGQFTDILLKRCDPEARVVSFDLSVEMLRRGVRRFDRRRALPVAADISQLPYRDGEFDAAVCGWVLEHLPDPLLGLREIARVLRPGGKLLILTTESTFFGAWVSRFYKCRTYRRDEILTACQAAGLRWGRVFWWSRFHQFLKLGGILVEAVKVPPESPRGAGRRKQVGAAPERY